MADREEIVMAASALRLRGTDERTMWHMTENFMEMLDVAISFHIVILNEKPILDR